MTPMRKFLLLVGVMALVATACTNDSTSVDAVPTTVTVPTGASAAGTTPAPEFPLGLDWLNVDQPLDLAALQGKIILLDFWTYGCINCIHIIPDLKRLETEYPDDLVVVGVHSAKFANEGETDNIREIIQRYDIRHPVVNDVNFEVWDSWGAQAWPTVALIDPAGNAVGIHAGEGVYEVVQPVVANLVAEFSAIDGLDPTPLPVRLEQDRSPNTVLSYPGKVHADPLSDRLFIADTGHHQIIAATDDGTVTAVFGSGLEGFDDGAGTDSSFSSPQGLVIDGDTLYVADTNNHAIRQIDLTTGAVTTLTGTGAKGWPPIGGALNDVELNSPWALELSGDHLYVANAGTHQVWTINLSDQTAAPSVGSGAEGTANGPLLETFRIGARSRGHPVLRGLGVKLDPERGDQHPRRSDRSRRRRCGESLRIRGRRRYRNWGPIPASARDRLARRASPGRRHVQLEDQVGGSINEYRCVAVRRRAGMEGRTRPSVLRARRSLGRRRCAVGG